MFESLTAEVLLSLAATGASGLAICGTLMALRATKRTHDDLDVDSVVHSAPYSRLHNVVQPNGGL